MNEQRIIFLCTGNSCRSQIAEAFLNQYAGDRYEAHSAGLEPKGLHPLAVKMMAASIKRLSNGSKKIHYRCARHCERPDRFS